MTTSGEGFNKSYAILKANADLLRRQTDLDIDGLVPIVEKSAEAYRICKERIDAVRAALKAHLPPDEPGDDSDAPK